MAEARKQGQWEKEGNGDISWAPLHIPGAVTQQQLPFKTRVTVIGSRVYPLAMTASSRRGLIRPPVQSAEGVWLFPLVRLDLYQCWYTPAHWAKTYNTQAIMPYRRVRWPGVNSLPPVATLLHLPRHGICGGPESDEINTEGCTGKYGW